MTDDERTALLRKYGSIEGAIRDRAKNIYGEAKLLEDILYTEITSSNVTEGTTIEDCVQEVIS